MKKNIAMRIAAFLFILTMISTCAFATTFAKYTTDGTATDSARVAKFGVTVVMTNYDVFDETYNSEAVKASASNFVDVVAPGTSGNLAGISITGTPEVKVNVAYTAVLELEGWLVGSTPYCPIVITVNGTKYVFRDDAHSGEGIDDFEGRVEGAIAAFSANYAANKNLADTDVVSPSVSWAWALNATDTGAHPNQSDANDTALGNWVLVEGASAPTISLSITCTVTQID